ncbi:hypothetical protein BSIN_4652 [Burkholderia singularis]|uniref:Uncharacterized protein n=1 Tax=Burkholderia singularis TaxID=1503053 RepID=A0A238H9P5_9BURK|nr:hypothetical protein BSIN_4652 [Burkholderia singularis]
MPLKRPAISTLEFLMSIAVTPCPIDAHAPPFGQAAVRFLFL